VLFDAFGLTFLFNLDDVGGDLAFLDTKWDAELIGDIYGKLADQPEMQSLIEERDGSTRSLTDGANKKSKGTRNRLRTMSASDHDRHSRIKSLPSSLHSSSDGSTQSLIDETNKKSKRKDKHKSRRTPSSPRHRHSRKRLDLRPARPSRTTSMEIRGQERKIKGSSYRNEQELSVKPPAKDNERIKQKNRTIHKQPSQFKSLDSAIDVSDRDTNRHKRDTSSTRKSAPAKQKSVESKHQNNSSNGNARKSHGSDDQWLRDSKLKARMPRLADASSPPGPSSFSSGSGHKSLRDSERKSKVTRIADDSSPPRPSSFASRMKRRADSNANSGDIGRSRSPSPEESLATRPGAQAVSLDGEEFRSSLDSRLLVSQSNAMDISGHSDHNETASTSTSLQATIVDEESHPEVEAIKAENERLRQRRLQQMESHRRCHTARHHQVGDLSTLGEIIEAFPEEENGEEGGGAKRKQRLLGAFLCCLLVAIAGAVGGVVGSNLIAKSQLEVPVDLPSSSPTSPQPSSPPNITMEYEPPSEEDCLAIENGDPVSGQDAMIVVTLDVGLEIVFPPPQLHCIVGLLHRRGQVVRLIAET